MKLLFIIAHKYYRKHECYTEYYINNINTFYNNDADILIVDNNSTHYQDIQDLVSKYNNVTFIINTSDSKFELGAYRFGINYISDKIKDYDYIIFTQDTFVLNKKYDFNNLLKNDVKACTIVAHTEYTENGNPFSFYNDEIKIILEKINMYNKLDKTLLCWCGSFILHSSSISNFMKFTNHIKIITKMEAEASERYLGRILYELNNHKNFNIDGNFLELKYNPNNNMISSLYFKSLFSNYLNEHYFHKLLNKKNEFTKD